MPVRRLLAEVDSRELTEWAAYEQIAGPLGGGRGDLHAAIVSATVVNANRGPKDRAAKVTDFLPEWDRKPTDWRDMLATVKAINKTFGGEEG